MEKERKRSISATCTQEEANEVTSNTKSLGLYKLALAGLVMATIARLSTEKAAPQITNSRVLPKAFYDPDTASIVWDDTESRTSISLIKIGEQYWNSHKQCNYTLSEIIASFESSNESKDNTDIRYCYHKKFDKFPSDELANDIKTLIPPPKLKILAPSLIEPSIYKELEEFTYISWVGHDVNLYLYVRKGEDGQFYELHTYSRVEITNLGLWTKEGLFSKLYELIHIEYPHKSRYEKARLTELCRLGLIEALDNESIS